VIVDFSQVVSVPRSRKDWQDVFVTCAAVDPDGICATPVKTELYPCDVLGSPPVTCLMTVDGKGVSMSAGCYQDAVAVGEVSLRCARVTFRRGDANVDGKRNIADAICTLGYLFGGPTDVCKSNVPKCLDAADANDDGKVNIADAIRLLSHLFANTGPLPPPFDCCGIDPTDDENSECEEFLPCR
jgi:hypothetical protein